MVAKLPNVACLSDRDAGRRVDFIVAFSGRGLVEALQRQIDFR